METHTHRTLKLLAVQRLFEGGCAAAAAEVRCPIARFRVDAAGYLDPLPERGGRRVVAAAPNAGIEPDSQAVRAFERDRAARTVIVECKASRADFLVDSRDADRLFRERERLQAVRAAMEDRFVKVVEPHLRREGTSLFEEFDDWDFAESRLPSYRKLLNDLRFIEDRLYSQRKFWTIRHYRLADYLYLAVPAGLIRPYELPSGWGLLEMDREPGQGQPLRVAVASTPAPGNPRHRDRMLRNIASAASRRLFVHSTRAKSGDKSRSE
jgi:hypothetical protein